jgi:hypothetical protein
VAEPKCQLAIKVVPGASRDGVAGWLGDALKIRVAAPPERGKANAAVERVLAEALGLSREAVRIVAGATSARKTVEVTGISESELRQRLGGAIE